MKDTVNVRIVAVYINICHCPKSLSKKLKINKNRREMKKKITNINWCAVLFYLIGPKKYLKGTITISSSFFYIYVHLKCPL